MERAGRRRAIGGALLAASVMALMCYLSLAALHGQNGLFRLMTIRTEEVRLRAQLAEIEAARHDMAGRNARMTAVADTDLLEAQAQKVLGLARPEDVLAR